MNVLNLLDDTELVCVTLAFDDDECQRVHKVHSLSSQRLWVNSVAYIFTYDIILIEFSIMIFNY